MPVKTYDMPLISSGLRQEEFIRQMVDSLEYLEKVSSDIFNRISESVAKQRDKLVDVNTRINKAEAQVEKLKSSRTKGTLVYSLPKYPAPPVLEDQRPIFSKVDDSFCEARRSKGDLKSKLEPANDKHLKDSTAYFILPSEVWPSESELMEGGFQRKKRKKMKEQLVEDEGLGTLPRYLPSITSLLLFNTSENPYRKCIISDPLSGVINKTRELEDAREGPSAAPYSILTREDLTRLAPVGLEYHPIMGEIPEFDVPYLLPDLPNVAEDIVYDADLGPSIAPSLANVELPTFADIETSSLISEAPPSLSDLPVPPTPLPPEPLDLEPPPPDQLEFDTSSDDSEEYDSTPGASPDPGDDRGALLDAIRAFKKDAILKPMDQRMVRKAQKQKKKDEFGGGDGNVMNDLKDRLLLRRKGISGQKQDRSGMLERMSMLIPAPVGNEGASGGAGDDSGNEEWTN